MKKKLKLTTFEKVWYPITGAFGAWGLTYVILGCLAKYLPIPESKNALAKADSAIASVFGLGFFGWGLIILGISVLATVICLLAVAKHADREFEKAQRRAARLNRGNMFDEESKPTGEVVEANFKEKN